MKGKSGLNNVQMNKNVNRRKRRNSNCAMFTWGTGANLPISESERAFEIYKSWRDTYSCDKSYNCPSSTQVCIARAPACPLSRPDRRGRTAVVWSWPQPHRQSHGLYSASRPSRTSHCQRSAAAWFSADAPSLTPSLTLRFYLHDSSHLSHESLEKSSIMVIKKTTTICW